MSDAAATILLVLVAGLMFWGHLRRDPAKVAFRQSETKRRDWDADTRAINVLIEQASKLDAIRSVLAEYGCDLEDYAEFCNFFRSIGMESGPNRDKAMLSPDVLRYFLENSRRETQNGKMVRILKDEVGEEVALRIGLCVINGTVP